MINKTKGGVYWGGLNIFRNWKYYGTNFQRLSINVRVDVVPMSSRRKHVIKRTHPNDQTSNEVIIDFNELALKYPDFAKELRKLRDKQNTSRAGPFSSFVTQGFNIALTRALVHSRFRLFLPSLPTGNLCPPVPNRKFYVQWIQEHLLPLLSNTEYFAQATKIHHRGIDIGTGASCIYPLLLCTADNSTTKWKILATEVDPVSAQSAQINVDANKFSGEIHVALVKPTDAQTHQSKKIHQNVSTSVPIDYIADKRGPISHALDAVTYNDMWNCQVQPTQTNVCTFDFVMTNPPFYDDAQSTERIDARAGDGRARIPMTAHEGNYPGGEFGFIKDMLRDSLLLKRKVSWYSAMCGKKKSFVKLQSILTQLLGSGHVQATEFGPGQMTRWFLAWTYQRPQSKSPSSRVTGGLQHFEVDIEAPSETEATSEITNRVCKYCREIPHMKLKCEILDDSTRLGCKVVTVQAQSIEGPTSHCQTSDAITAESVALEFAPEEGYFWIDFFDSLSAEKCPSSTSCPKTSSICDKAREEIYRSKESTNSYSVGVQLACYRHSVKGGQVIDRIRSQLVGEVRQTNRRWKRMKTKHGCMAL